MNFIIIIVVIFYVTTVNGLRGRRRLYEKPCLKSEDICPIYPDKQFHNGCNNCICMGNTKLAACTRVACRPFRTLRQYKDHCDKIKKIFQKSLNFNNKK